MDPLIQDSLVRKFMKLAELVSVMEKKPWRFGTEEWFSGHEIHLIEVIGKTENLSVSDIARSLEITKGAVSQSLMRLEKRGIVEKEADVKNLSRSIVLLTKKGKTIYRVHREWHKTRDGGFLKFIERLDEKQVMFLKEVLEKVTDFVQNRLMAED